MPQNAESTTFLRVERPSPGVALITLDDPDRRNVMSDEMTTSWVQAIDRLSTDDNLRAVVVTGAGTSYCSGGDIGWITCAPG